MHTLCNAIIVAEVEFRKITVQMMLSAMLIDTLHAALEDTEIAFEGVGVAIAALPFLLAVIDAFMAGEILCRSRRNRPLDRS